MTPERLAATGRGPNRAIRILVLVTAGIATSVGIGVLIAWWEDSVLWGVISGGAAAVALFWPRRPTTSAAVEGGIYEAPSEPPTAGRWLLFLSLLFGYWLLYLGVYFLVANLIDLPGVYTVAEWRARSTRRDVAGLVGLGSAMVVALPIMASACRRVALPLRVAFLAVVPLVGQLIVAPGVLGRVAFQRRERRVVRPVEQRPGHS